MDGGATLSQLAMSTIKSTCNTNYKISKIIIVHPLLFLSHVAKPKAHICG